MKASQKIARLRKLSSEQVLRAELFYDILEECEALKPDYSNYASTHPIDCNRELRQFDAANYELCCALITMLLREDYFSNGTFDRRQRSGQVKPIIDRMIMLLENESNT